MGDGELDFWWLVAATAAAVIVLAILAKRVVFRMVQGERDELGDPDSETRLRRDEPILLGPGVPCAPEDDLRCLACGDVATEPMPAIERGRGARDWFRELFAMPPRYRRVVRVEGPLILCRPHAHVADAMVDEFLHNRVRGAFSAAYTKVAVEAASFEKEFLQRQLSESLTEDQKRAAKRAGSNVPKLLKTADGAGT